RMASPVARRSLRSRLRMASSASRSICQPRGVADDFPGRSRMNILMAASEALPFAKTGGLADVVGALPAALVRLGHRVDVVMPRYRGMPSGESGRRFPVAMGPLVAYADASIMSHQGVRFVVIDNPGYFDRDHLYGAGGHDYADNPERFAFLCKAALEW